MDDAQRREFERVRVAVERSRIALSTRDLYDWFLILAAGAMALAALEQGRWRAAWFLAVFAAAWAADGSQSAKSIRIALARQIAVALAIAAYAGWRGFSGQPGADSLLAAGAALAFVAGESGGAPGNGPRVSRPERRCLHPCWLPRARMTGPQSFCDPEGAAFPRNPPITACYSRTTSRSW